MGNNALKGDHYFETWIDIVRAALSCLDQERYTWNHLPILGGYYDQDDFLLTCWEYVRYEYMNARNDESFLKTLNKGK